MRNRKSVTQDSICSAESMDPHSQVDTCMEWSRWRFRGVLHCIALAGYGKARVIVGRRTFEEQAYIYGKGRSGDEMAVVGIGKGYARPEEARVSWLDPRYSRHVQGLAIDIDWSDYPVDS